jgi:hypothetical protein
MVKVVKKSFLQLNQFFILMIFSLLLIFLNIYLITKNNEFQSEKLNKHFKELENEKLMVLILNDKLFSLVYYYCYNFKDNNLLNDYFEKLKEENIDLAVKLDCLNGNSFNYGSFKNCKLTRSLSSYYFNLDICLK